MAEYRTTMGTIGHGWADDPVPPEEIGNWILITAAATNGVILWFWRRE